MLLSTHNISKHATGYEGGEMTCIFNKVVASFAISTGVIMHFGAAGKMEKMIDNHELITSVMLDPPIKIAKISNMFLSFPKPMGFFSL